MRRVRITPVRTALLVAAPLALSLSVAYAATLSTTSTTLWAGGQTLTKTTCALGAANASTAWVDESAPTTSNGGTTLSVQAKNNARQYAFIRFDLGSCSLPATGGADAATLTLTVESATKSHTISLYPVYSGWSAGSLTWSSAQSLTVGSTATASFANTTGTHALTVTADVDAAIKTGALWGWELVDTSNGTAATTIASQSFGTAGDRPTLTIDGER